MDGDVVRKQLEQEVKAESRLEAHFFASNGPFSVTFEALVDPKPPRKHAFVRQAREEEVARKAEEEKAVEGLVRLRGLWFDSHVRALRRRGSGDQRARHVDLPRQQGDGLFWQKLDREQGLPMC